MVTKDLEKKQEDFVSVLLLTLSSNLSQGLVFFCRGGSLLNFNLLYSVLEIKILNMHENDDVLGLNSSQDAKKYFLNMK